MGVGIYRILNTITNQCYYGSSKEISKRLTRHKNELTKNKHHNQYLQRAFNKYGENSFVFEIVEYCCETKLLDIEQKYLDLPNTYNIGKTAMGGDNISKNPNRDIIVENIRNSVINRYDNMTVEERKEKYGKFGENNPNWKGGISKNYCKCGLEISVNAISCNVCRDRTGVKNPFYNKTHSDEIKRILSEKRKGKKPSNIKPFYIDDIKYLSLKDAEIATGIKATTIRHRIISKNKKYEKYKYTK